MEPIFVNYSLLQADYRRSAGRIDLIFPDLPMAKWGLQLPVGRPLVMCIQFPAVFIDLDLLVGEVDDFGLRFVAKW